MSVRRFTTIWLLCGLTLAPNSVRAQDKEEAAPSQVVESTSDAEETVLSPGVWVGIFQDQLTRGFLEIVVSSSGSVLGRYVTSGREVGTFNGSLQEDSWPMPFNLDKILTPAGCDQVLEPSVRLTNSFLLAEYEVTNCDRKHKGRARMLKLPKEVVQAFGSVGKPELIQFVKDSSRFQGSSKLAMFLSGPGAEGGIRDRLAKEPGISLTDQIDKADLILVMVEAVIPIRVEVWDPDGYSYPTDDLQQFGMGLAAIRENGKLLVFWIFEDENTTHWERHPTTNFIRNFLKLHRKHNQRPRPVPNKPETRVSCVPARNRQP